VRPTQMRPVAVSIRPQVRVPVSHIASFLNVTADKHQNKETVDKSENREKFKFWTDLKALDRSRQRSCRARCARVRCAIVQSIAEVICDGAMHRQGWFRVTSTVRGVLLFDDVLVTSSIY